MKPYNRSNEDQKWFVKLKERDFIWKKYLVDGRIPNK
jgi:hypothetical protein